MFILVYVSQRDPTIFFKKNNNITLLYDNADTFHTYIMAP